MYSIFVFCMLSAIIQPATPSVREIEEQVLQYRRSIQQGHVVLRQKAFRDGQDKPFVERISTIWFDGKRIRSDIVTGSSSEGDHVREIKCRNCEREDYTVWYVDQKIEGARVALTMRKEEEARKAGIDPVIDPRLLGVAADSVPNFSKYHLESYVGKSDRREPTVQRSKWKSRDCWQIDYRDLRGTEYRYYVDSARGSSVIRLEVSWDTRGHHFVDAVETEFGQFGPSNTWFPNSCTYQRDEDGKPIQKEVVDVEVVSLNESLDPDIFKLKGMSIPPDTYISGLRAENGHYFWNGKEIVLDVEKSRNKYTSTPTSRNVLLIINAILLALVAAFFFHYYFRRRRETD